MGIDEESASRTVSIDSASGTKGLDKGSPEKTNVSSSSSSLAEDASPSSLILPDSEEPSVVGLSVFEEEVIQPTSSSSPSISTRPSIFRRIGSLLKYQKSEKSEIEQSESPTSSGTAPQQAFAQSRARSFFSQSIKVYFVFC
jgi:hypothetical protein